MTSYQHAHSAEAEHFPATEVVEAARDMGDEVKAIHQRHLLSRIMKEGDPTGNKITYIASTGGRLRHAHSLREVLLASGSGLRIDEVALSHLLHDGFVPLPRTIFQGVHALGIGDRATVTGHGADVELELTVDFPYLQRRSAADQTPDPERLLRLLCTSLERALAPYPSAVLMLSSGLDSVPLALAAAEIGRAADITALTFDQHGSGEGEVAATFARRFGLRHVALRFPQGSRDVADLMEEFFTSADQPCCDPATLAYAATLRQAGVRGMPILDGSGSDVYLGEIPTRRNQMLDPLHRLPDPWIGPLRAALPFWSPLNKVVSSRCEKTFVDEYHLRYQETRSFFAGSVDTSVLWRRQDRELADLDFTDLTQCIAMRHVDANCGMLKARLAAATRGGTAVFPWCDPDVISYCFNLPDIWKRGNRSWGNKPLVREMLRRYADYDAVTQRKKVIFSFHLPDFLRTNKALVEHEVRSSPLWARSVRETLAMLWRTLDDNRSGTAVALHTLFCVSAWLNHADILERLKAQRSASPTSSDPSPQVA